MKFKGEYLCSLRQQAGYKQEALADSLKMSQPNLSRIETGKQNITMKHITHLARAMNKSPDEVSHFLQHGATTIHNSINDQAQNNQNVVNFSTHFVEQLLAEKDKRITEKEKQIEEQAKEIALLKAKS
jgi:transcriptional regulator with XRE-family HTH domain